MSDSPIFDELARALRPAPSPVPRAASTAVQVLEQGGILRAGEVVELATAAGLDLAAAATLLIKESGGGRNLWGHDAVNTGGLYVKGSEVTKAAYLAYKAQRTRLGAQGVGPCQLTWPGYQDQADQLGGCWDWRCNVTIGFRALAGGIKARGLREGFRRYNGSGPAAERYAGDAMAKYGAWKSRLAGTGGIDPSSAGTLREGDTGPAVVKLQSFLNTTFPSYSKIDIEPQRYGPQTVSVVKEFQRRSGVSGPDADGTVVGPRTLAALARYGYR